MKRLIRQPAAWIVPAILCIIATACCDDAASTGATGVEPSAVSETSTAEPVLPYFKTGIDAYIGTSDMFGRRRYTDGMWAGSGAFYPSMTYLESGSSGGRVARLSLGMGDLYTDEQTTLNQPIEAYWQQPMGGAVVTFGKYWVPFAQQEWLYESKPGVMMTWDRKRVSLTASANYSQELRRPITYLSSRYRVSSDAEFGLSLAVGRGFCSDSVHDRGIGLDAIIGYKGWRFYGECNRFSTGQKGKDFDYISGKLCYEKLGAWMPFVAAYSWKDRSDTFGEFRSTVYGVTYQATPELAVEAAISPTCDGRVSWLQLHWAWEKSVSPGQAL